jgi:hypothetical protein
LHVISKLQHGATLKVLSSLLIASTLASQQPITLPKAGGVLDVRDLGAMNPHHPTPTGDSWADGLDNQITSSHASIRWERFIQAEACDAVRVHLSTLGFSCDPLHRPLLFCHAQVHFRHDGVHTFLLA